MLDPKGNRYGGWKVGEKRGLFSYDAPVGWIGFGLKVKGRYEDDLWLDKINCSSQFIAYHGVGRKQDSDNVKKIIGFICNDLFKPGTGQMHKDCPDKYHKNNKVVEEVYFSEKIRNAEDYAGIININKVNYKVVLMVRMNIFSTRACGELSHFSEENINLVASGTFDDVRPYRILLKKCE